MSTLTITVIAETVGRLMNSETVVLNRPAVGAGLAMLEAGGDFADGAIAYEGSWLGAETFVAFDRRAVKLPGVRGEAGRLLS
jgi:predicted nucleic-acid-binding protein